MSVKNKKKKSLRVILISLLILLLVGTGVTVIYLADYSKASSEAIAVMADSSISITTFDGGVAFGDQDSQTGFIFYPGGKVEYTAYAPLLQKVAQGGIFCVIPEMPFNLAVLDSKAAEKVMDQFPGIETWYIGGHSLGGAMAADYAAKNPTKFAGVILLAAYSISDISESGLQVLLMYGSEDRVLNMERYKEGLSYLPDDYTEFIIDGGNHAQFGDYGLQDGDGTAAIAPMEQWNEASETILEYIKKTAE